MTETEQDSFDRDLLAFLGGSPTPFHAVEHMHSRLGAAGFEVLAEGDAWRLEPGGRYVVTRNGSSLIAFRLGSTPPEQDGLRMIGAHTDSPCLKLKPRPVIGRHGCVQLGVEVYGGALLNPWFDRDLSLAGRVSFRGADGRMDEALIDFRDPVACIPSLAIHLDRDANDARTVNAQTDMPALIGIHAPGKDAPGMPALLRERLRTGHPERDVEEVLDFELCLYDTQPPAVIGLEREFIAGSRLDNLLSCYVGMRAMLDAPAGHGAVLVCSDHEEVGSRSAAGAEGRFLQAVLERVCDGPERLARCLDRSLLVSADNAHAVHPNHADRHDEGHGPLLNGGPVIKVNASQQYASNSRTAGLFRHLCEREQVPVQTFAMRADLRCGSTIGPITAARLGVPTVDVGIAQLAMHSARELAGRLDPPRLARVLAHFLAEPALRPGR